MNIFTVALLLQLLLVIIHKHYYICSVTRNICYFTAADDYNIVNSFVKLQENRNGVLELIIPPSDKGFDTITSFRLDVMEESHIIPRNVFFRGADVNIVDIPG